MKFHFLTLWRARQLCFFYVRILPELNNRLILKEIDLICWGIVKVKILYKISGMKFSSLELKLNGFAVKPPPMKGLIKKLFYFLPILVQNFIGKSQSVSLKFKFRIFPLPTFSWLTEAIIQDPLLPAWNLFPIFF